MMKPTKNEGLVSCFTRGCLIASALSSLAHAAPIEFTEAEGYTEGDLNGQQGWIASTGGFLSNQVDATAGVVTSQNGEIAVYDTAHNLVVGETFSYSLEFQFADFTESGLVPPAAGEFWYMVRTGLKETNEAVRIGNDVPSGSTRLQAFEDNVRLLNNAFGAGTAGGIGAPLALDTVYTIGYSLTLGADAASTSFSISVNDGVATASGVITGISETLYDDLATGDGAYLFFQTDTLVQGGIDAVQLLTVDIGGTAPPPSGDKIDFLAAEGFVEGDLNGQQGWTASTGQFLSNQVNPSSGVVTSQNNEIAVYDTAYKLAAGESFSYTASFRFSDFTESGLVPPGFEEFWSMLRTGLKESNEAVRVGNDTPGGTAKFQAYEDNVRLLDNGFTPATPGTGSALALATNYTIGYSLILGADAASSNIAVSLTDGTATVEGVIPGISEALYQALTTGAGAYLFFQADGVVQGGIDAVQLDTVQIEGATPPPSGTFVDFLAAEGFGAGDLNGQQGWTASTGQFLSNQVNPTSGVVTSQNNEIAVYDTAYTLAVGETLSFAASFRFSDFTEGGLVPPGFEEFWSMLRTGLKESNEAVRIGNDTPGGTAKFQAYEDNVRLLDNGFTPATPGTGSALALGTDYTIGYSLTLGADAGSTNIAVSLNDGTTTVEGSIPGISEALYQALSSGAGAYVFFQADGVVQGGIDAVQLESVLIEAPETPSTEGIFVTAVSYDAESGCTINYTSSVGPVDVWVNETGSLATADFELLAEGETGGTFVDDGATGSKVFYILTTAGEAP